MTNKQTNNLKNFFSEIQMLKRIKHEGWRMAGVEAPDSVGEHTVIAAQIAYVLGKLEGADAAKCALIALFHDNDEVRIGDQHKVAARYFDVKVASRLARGEQFANLPNEIADELNRLQEEGKRRDTKEGIVAKDADWLEMAIQAKIYCEAGHKGAADWIKNVEKALETKSAQAILATIKSDPDFTNSWWPGLKKMTHKKLSKQ